jgi:hypothetical protein
MQGQPLPLTQVRRIVSQIGDALDYAHQRGLIHRDVKPSNVLMDERSNCLLTDFGLAKIVEGSIHLTTSGMILGTPAYMSPEQGLGAAPDPRSDIYSLGVILYQTATGRIPYNAETPLAIVHKHIYDPLPLPHTLNDTLPEAVERVILKSLGKKPEDRFGTAGEMVSALQAAIPDAASSSRPEMASRVSPSRESDRFIEQPIGRAESGGMSQNLWKPALLVGAGWAIGILLGLTFMRISPILGGVIAGAAGGLGIGLAWRRMEASVSPRQMLILMVIWGLALGMGRILGPLFFLMGGLGGWLSGLLLQQVRPALSRRQVAIIALGWLLSWLVGGLLFVLTTIAFKGPLAGLLTIIAMLLAGVIGGGVMFSQYRETYR